MTPGKIKLVADYYLNYLMDAGVMPERSDSKLPRAAWCARELATMEDEGKANRWLGFIQGVLFAKDIFDVDQLRDHSRKDSPLGQLNEPVTSFTEKDRRVYYQDIVYAVCAKLDMISPSPVVCGTVEEPSTQVQDAVSKLLRIV